MSCERPGGANGRGKPESGKSEEEEKEVKQKELRKNHGSRCKGDCLPGKAVHVRMCVRITTGRTDR